MSGCMAPAFFPVLRCGGELSLQPGAWVRIGASAPGDAGRCRYLLSAGEPITVGFSSLAEFLGSLLPIGSFLGWRVTGAVCVLCPQVWR